MKRMIAWMLCLMVALTLTCAGAETAGRDFEDLAGLEWSFSSGVGAWSTDLRIQPDGSFYGEYHDSEMGESADEYPDGSYYFCSFSGHMTRLNQADEYSWTVRIDELKTDPQEEETIEDGVRYVKAEPYGVSAGDEMQLYRPGTPVSMLPEEMLIWTHVQDMETPPEELQDWFLCSTANDSGFVSWKPVETVAIPNPWEDMTADELLAETGFSFVLPEGAEDILWRYLRAEGLAEVQFTLDGGEYCARVQPADLQEGEMMNISGMYFVWDREEPVRIGHCDGTLCYAQTGSEDRAEVCQWYDAAPGLMYSLSLSATMDHQVDLAAMAEQIFVPVQGEI